MNFYHNSTNLKNTKPPLGACFEETKTAREKRAVFYETTPLEITFYS